MHYLQDTLHWFYGALWHPILLIGSYQAKWSNKCFRVNAWGVLIYATIGSGLISVLTLFSVLLPHRISFAPRWIWISMPLLLASLVFHAAYICYHSVVAFYIHGILANMFRLRGVGNLTDVGAHSPVQCWKYISFYTCLCHRKPLQHTSFRWLWKVHWIVTLFFYSWNSY